jgi:hypothetical protein
MPQSGRRDRNPGRDREVPSEDAGREAQDRPKTDAGRGGAKSPVDSMHVDAPRKQDNEQGHKRERRRT